MAAENDQEATKAGDSFRRILLASDLTAYSDRAFDRVALLAKLGSTAVRLIHSVETEGLPDDYLDSKVREAETYLRREVRDSGLDRFSDVSISIVTGGATAAIAKEARAMQADMIVLGLTHDDSLIGMIRGTTIDTVVRHSNIPVLVVKTRARRPYTRIAAAVDLAEPSWSALEFALRTFPHTDVHVIHVTETEAVDRKSQGPELAASARQREQVADRVRAAFAKFGRCSPGEDTSSIVHFAEGTAVNLLPQLLSTLDPDLVVAGTHGRTGIANLVLGSVAETLLDVVHRDMLVVRR